MQTPLQMLIEILDREALDNTGFYTPGEFEVIASVKKHATELLEKERSTIERAYSVGLCQNCFNGVTAVSNKMASDYFTKTFTKKTINMIAKKVTRYYSDCGRGFWKKEQAINHDENCKCWVNPKFQCCLSCKNKNIVKDSNGMENEPQFLQKWNTNQCKHSELGVPVHENFEHIRKYCPYYENKKTR